MKFNYDNEMLKIIDNLEETKKLLLHSCCGPCSSYVLSCLADYFEITVLYYNPNIEPLEEYEKRKKEQIRFINSFNGKNKIDFIDCDYDNETFEKMCVGLENKKEGGQRCHKCYLLRLEETAKKAKKLNYDYFCSTLSVSPYKNAEILNKIGYVLENKYNVNYLPNDFKKRNGYLQSIKIAKEYNLYRQNYCGCKYSFRNEVNDD